MFVAHHQTECVMIKFSPPSYAVLVALFLLTSSCFKKDTLAICRNSQSIELAGEGCLLFIDQGELTEHQSVIEDVIREAVVEVHDQLPEIRRVGIQVEAGTRGVIPELGFGGRAFIDEISLVFDPGFLDLEQSIEDELRPLLLHELHHILRHRATSYSPNLAGIFINEGLADHFSMELAGSDPPIWSTVLEGEELEQWIETAGEVWLDEPVMDSDAWLFGSAEIPRWAGYAIGFELVRRYLETHPGIRVSELLGEPAESFLPD